LATVPNIGLLERLVERRFRSDPTNASDFTLAIIEVIGLTNIIEHHGNAAGDEVLRQTIRCTRTSLRVTDMLFRYDVDRLVALLSNTEPTMAVNIAERIRQHAVEYPVTLRSGTTLALDLSVRCVSAPRDGHSVSQLMATAHRQLTARSQRAFPQAQ